MDTVNYLIIELPKCSKMVRPYMWKEWMKRVMTKMYGVRVILRIKERRRGRPRRRGYDKVRLSKKEWNKNG